MELKTVRLREERLPEKARESLKLVGELYSVRSEQFRRYVALALAVGLAVLEGKEAEVLFLLERGAKTGVIPEVLVRKLKEKGVNLEKDDLEVILRPKKTVKSPESGEKVSLDGKELLSRFKTIEE